MKYLKPSWLSLAGAAAALAPYKALAVSPFDTANKMVSNVQTASGITGTRSLPDIIGSIINVLLSFLGVVFLVLLIYAGFLWMTAQGDKTKVEKAQDMIRQAVIGLIVIVAAFAISGFVLNSLVNVTNG